MVFGHFLEFSLLDQPNIAWIGLKMRIPIGRMYSLVLMAVNNEKKSLNRLTNFEQVHDRY